MIRHNLLRKWLTTVLLENPEILDNKEVTKIYSAIQNIWVDDVQNCLKEIIKEVLIP